MGRVRCGNGWSKHTIMQDSRGEIPLPDGNRMVIFFCNRVDWHGNAVCNYKDTLILRTGLK